MLAASDVHPHQAGNLQHGKHVTAGQDPGHDGEGHPEEGGQLTPSHQCPSQEPITITYEAPC